VSAVQGKLRIDSCAVRTGGPDACLTPLTKGQGGGGSWRSVGAECGG
jgi:hypothetical protein